MIMTSRDWSCNDSSCVCTVWQGDVGCAEVDVCHLVVRKHSTDRVNCRNLWVTEAGDLVYDA